jgi:alanine dehydrogenase
LVKLIADEDIEKTLKHKEYLRNAVNVYKGNITIEEIAKEFGYEYKPIDGLFL